LLYLTDPGDSFLKFFFGFFELLFFFSSFVRQWVPSLQQLLPLHHSLFPHHRSQCAL
jgi:hypothetical protein